MTQHTKMSSQRGNAGSKSNQSKNTPVMQDSHPQANIQNDWTYPKFLTHAGVMQLQRIIGNWSVTQLFKDIVNNRNKPVQNNQSAGEKKRTTEINKKILPDTVQKKENNTGLPDKLKSGVESLSGIDMSDVKVHYNSSKPAGVGALAYTQGTDIHVAPGQERHLNHEVWHVVQQKQGRVQPTMQLKGLSVNDDSWLEREADQMGRKLLNGKNSGVNDDKKELNVVPVVQRYMERSEITDKKGNLSPEARVSEHGNIIWQDKRSVYAKPGLFDYANSILRNKSQFVLEQDEAAQFDMYLSPYNDVFKAEGNYFKVAPKYNPAINSFLKDKAPSAGDSSEKVQTMHGQYLAELNKIHQYLDELLNEKVSMWGRQSAGTIQMDFKDWATKKHPIISMTVFEKLWPVVLEYSNQKYGMFFDRNMDGLKHGINEVRAFADKIINRESQTGAYDIMAPNDCQKMAEMIVGGTSNVRRTDYSADTPGVGENYYTRLSSHKDIEQSWGAHFAGVIMVDQGDRLTLETAANENEASYGKAGWYFEMYGTRRREQTFKRKTHLLHHERNLATLWEQAFRGKGSVPAYADTKKKIAEINSGKLERDESENLF